MARSSTTNARDAVATGCRYNVWLTLEYADLLEVRMDTRRDGERVTRHKPAFQIVWLDAHASGKLDSVWREMYTPRVRRGGPYLQGRMCFRKALFIPPGYTSPLYNWPDDCPYHHYVREWENYVLNAYGLIDTKIDPLRATFLLREPFAADPRQVWRRGHVGGEALDERDIYIYIERVRECRFRASIGYFAHGRG